MTEPKPVDPQKTLTMAEWEKELNIMFVDYSPNKKLTREEVSEIELSRGTVGVDYEPRKKFLQDNGYELTRENFMDITLNTKEPEDDES